MAKMIFKCPVCNETLQVTTLQCGKCGLELKNNFELSPFDKLDEEKMKFLLIFLQAKGNLSLVKNILGISYTNAQTKLQELLQALDLVTDEAARAIAQAVDTSAWQVDAGSSKPSEIIKQKLKENGGLATVLGQTGRAYQIRATADGNGFSCDLMTAPSYKLVIFDELVKYMQAHGGRIAKGNGRFYKFGEPQCDENTVVGIIAINYQRPKVGDSVLDPVHFFAAILDWGDIAYNKRGYLELKESYKKKQ